VGTDFLLLILGAVAVGLLTRRIGALERTVAALCAELRVAELRGAAPRAAAIEPEPEQTLQPEPALLREPARVVDALASPPPAAPAPPPEPTATLAERFEALVAGKLPIWIGGAALVLAGLFLVRYGIESGLIGPAVRVVLAALFSAALLAGSEATRRLAATRDDPRLAQVLAGAGIASAYGTLYVAAAQYHLVGAAAGFACMVAITGGALFLSLRHGPPTAVMALIGGFAAPLVAGFDAAGVAPLLGYLALFIAALFSLAAARGWTWLAIAAILAGFGWANLVVLLLDGRDSTLVAAFVTALAIGATLALPRTGAVSPWLRAAPIVAGLAQLLVLAPALDFSPVAWCFHLVLAGAALYLARRDPVLEGAALAAALLVTTLLALALWGTPAPGTASLVAAAVATVLFAGTGLAWSREGTRWAAVALVGLAGPVLVAHLARPSLLPPAAWSLLELALAAAAAYLSWRHRDAAAPRDTGLVGGAATAALLAGIALSAPVPLAYASLALVPVLAALVWWGRRLGHPDVQALPALVALAMLLLAARPLADLGEAVATSLLGEELIYPLLPSARDALLALALPTLAIGAVLLRVPGSFGRWRTPVGIGTALVATAALYLLAKQPLAIATPERFVALGFHERAAITLLFAGAGVLVARRTAYTRVGRALVIAAVARALWFDLLLLSPVFAPQAVGALPLLNTAILLSTLLALAARSFPGREWRWTMLGFTLLAVAAAVRQLAHGSILTGPVSLAENWGYSAAYLALAIAWLWRGLTVPGSGLRTAGLLLLTLVTVKVFLLDVAALGGVLRILSFLGLGLALIGIGWFYRRTMARTAQPSR
jgi:hypothetical protein